MKEYRLINDVPVPAVGLGTWQITDREVLRRTLEEALETGYRLVDTAAAYGNEISLGKCIKDMGRAREELFLQDKLWNTGWGYEAAKEACGKSLKKLKTDYLDAYLIHYPATRETAADWMEINAENWRALEDLYRAGHVRAIGICNFGTEQLEALQKTAIIPPMIHQIECHPGLPQREMIAFCQAAGIHVEGASPLGSGRIAQESVLGRVAAKHGKSPAQTALRWALQKNLTVLPKSVNGTRLRENMDLFDFSLDQGDMEDIDGIPFRGSVVAEWQASNR